MSVQWRRSFIGVSSLVLTLLFGAQPVLADTEIGHSGTVGFHSLEDSESAAGATCRYKSVAEHNDLKLARIIVEAPLMRAVAGKSAQAVGWRFTVQRRVAGIGGSFPWKNRYTSPEMTAVTDDTHEASFDRASIRVRPGPRTAGGTYQYRVVVTMLWHRADGSVQGKARHRVDFYRIISDTGLSAVQNNNCEAYWLQPDE